MNKQTIALLRTSFAEIARRRPDVAAVFYKRLFEVAPDVRPMFSPSMKEQQKKLTASLAQIVASLEQPQKLEEHLVRLGERHVEYDVKPAHYNLVGETLLWTFQQVLQQNFTKPVRAAWLEAYTIVSKKMIAAGEAARAQKKKSPAAKTLGAKTPNAKAVEKIGSGAPAVRRVKKRAATTAADSGKRKAARRPVRKPARRTKRAG